MPFSYLAHKRACKYKQDEREERIHSLGLPATDVPLSKEEIEILNKPIADIVAGVHAEKLDAVDVLMTYSRMAVRAQAETNCLTEIFVREAREQASDQKYNKTGPLAGVPVSLKDSVAVKGQDNCVGYSAKVRQPAQRDSALTRLLKDAGALPFVKTNVPITVMSFESVNDLFGRTTNPHNKAYTAGGSTGGEAALLAYGGSRIGIGTDAAGSIIVPGHFCGAYGVKASVGRFPRTGSPTGILAQPGIPVISSPMARTLEDLEYFWKAVMDMQPWKYDNACLRMPWKPYRVPKDRPLRWGVMRSDGVVTMSPACTRALDTVIDVLRANGHEVFDISPPDPCNAIRIGSQLLMADGCKGATKDIRPFENNAPGFMPAIRMVRLPGILRRPYTSYIRYIKRDEKYAGFLDGWHTKSTPEAWALMGEKEGYRSEWFEFWNELQLDFVLTAPHALPAVPHNGMDKGWRACGYSFLFNVLDCTTGVLPVTHVDAKKDQLPKDFKPSNAIEAGAYDLYDANSMHGLPLGVQVVGQRLEEEKVLGAMRYIEELLTKESKAYKPMPIS